MNTGSILDINLEKQRQFRMELRKELTAILTWWGTVAVDVERGGFYGAVNNNDIPDKNAPKGSVMMARICWAFSEASRFHPRKEWELLADRSFEYLVQFFIDREHGGTFWSVNPVGEKLDGRKQVYGQAFCLYAFAAYYRVTSSDRALQLAYELFDLIEKHSLDTVGGGYIEAFAQGWSPVSDLRLSDKDENERKTTNTHLHIVEAYAMLYRVSPSPFIKERIQYLLDIFNKHIIRPNGELHLFFDDKWNSKSSLRSFGHEIEAAWLLLDCAEAIKDAERISCFKQHAIRLSGAALQGMDADGGLWYEWQPEGDQWIREKHSWPQAEAMIAFVVLWQLTGEEHWHQKAQHSWHFIKTHLSDNSGEWFWGVDEQYQKMDKDKAGFWKCPYHNSRAILEILYRLSA